MADIIIIAPLANLLQRVDDFSGINFYILVLKLALLKIIAVLKTLICNIFFKSVYRVKVCRLSCAFGGMVCLKNEIVDGFPE